MILVFFGRDLRLPGRGVHNYEVPEAFPVIPVVGDVLALGDGTPSFVRFCIPPAPIQGRVVLSHGVSEHGGRYEHVMQALAQKGIASAIADHRGHGQSASGGLALTHALPPLADDLHVVRGALVERAGEGPVLLWGHSMGGLVALLHLAQAQSKYVAAVLASAATVIPPYVPKVLIKLANRIAKASPAMPLLPSNGTDHLTRDPQMAQRTQEDPLMYTGGMRAATGAGILNAILQVPSLAPKVRLPVLVTHGDQDKVMPVQGSRDLHARLGSMDKTLRIYEGWVHELHNDLGRAQYLDETIAWIERQFAASSSRSRGPTFVEHASP